MMCWLFLCNIEVDEGTGQQDFKAINSLKEEMAMVKSKLKY